MKHILETPNAVIYRYSNSEFEKIINEYLSQQVNEHIIAYVALDSEYIDLFDIHLDEGENSEEVLQKLSDIGFPYDDITTLKNNILNELFHPKHRAFAYMKSEDGDEFDVLIHIPYEEFIKLTKK